MTTGPQAKANKINAQKSTGPTSATGKAKSAANAKKHGLTTPPERAAVLRWYQIILNDASAYPNPFERNERLRTAHALAESEARLERVCAAEQTHLQKLHRYIDRRGQKSYLELADDPVEDPEALAFILKREDDPVAREGIRILLLSHPNRPAALRRKMRILARYRREAEAQRRRALGRWIAALETQLISKFPKQSQLQL
jgi:hypothetical protein